MNTLSALPIITKDYLLGGLDRKKRKSIESIAMDADVKYVVLLESEDQQKRTVLTVGPNLEYSDLDAVLSVSFDEMSPKGYVEASMIRSRKSFLFKRGPSVDFQEQLDLLQAENEKLHMECSQYSKHSRSLEERERKLLQQEEESAQVKVQLQSREVELLKMEEELMGHMNQLVQKQAEMEQWEEDMFARERAFAEKQSKPPCTVQCDSAS